MPEFVLFPGATEELRLMTAHSPVMRELAEELKTMIADLTPELSSYYGKTSAVSPTLKASLEVAETPVGFAIVSADYQFVFVELGFMHEGGLFIAAVAPFRRAAERFAAEHNAVFYPRRSRQGS